jgi:ornithine--oxo-acid transaminase
MRSPRSHHSSDELIEITESYSAHNYSPLPVVISRGEGAWVWDVEGKRYLDMLSAYSALNFGHRNPRITAVAHEQLDLLTLTSRAFYNDQLGALCRELADFCGLDSVLLMNSGAEAVESAIKIARRWAYQRKGIPAGSAEIIALGGNFHGRTISIVSFSTSEDSRKDFGPFTPGFVTAAYGDSSAFEAAITERTAAVIFEPIQGEGGVLIPPEGYLRDLRRICTERNLLLLADEVQTGLCRTGKRFACDWEGVKPDAYILGKSLGGGIVPISAVVARREVMDVLNPGSHGSTFGGNPFACAIAREVLALIVQERPEDRAVELGNWFGQELRGLNAKAIGQVRQRGLFVGVDIKPEFGKAKDYCKKLLKHGILAKDTREQTIRFAPPLVIAREDLEWGIEQIRATFGDPPLS